MLVAITGASGFIGSYTVRALRAAGHEVRALARRTSRRDHIAEFVDQWTEGDIADPPAQAAPGAGVDAVIHNALDSDAIARSATTHFDRNVLASLNLLEAAQVAGARQFVFVSSAAVYHEIPPSAN